MLEMGRSRPWPEALEVMTGEKQMDATAILDYFAPLKKWLDEQNAKDGASWIGSVRCLIVRRRIRCGS